MVKSCLWLGNASPPSQTCTHHGGKTDTEYRYTSAPIEAASAPIEAASAPIEATSAPIEAAMHQYRRLAPIEGLKFCSFPLNVFWL